MWAQIEVVLKTYRMRMAALGCWMFDSLGTCANPAMIFSMIGVLSLLGIWPMTCEYSALSGRLWLLESRSPALLCSVRLCLAVSVDATAIYLVSPPSEKIWGSDSESTTDFTRYDVNVCLMDDIERWLLSSDCRFRYPQRSSRWTRPLLSTSLQYPMWLHTSYVVV